MANGVLIMTVLLFSIAGIGSAEAVNYQDYVIFTDNYFIVFGHDNGNVILIDGGVIYNDEFILLSFPDIETEQLDENGEKGWFKGKLESGNKFWFMWDTTENIITGFWVHDGFAFIEKIPEINPEIDRLFF